MHKKTVILSLQMLGHSDMVKEWIHHSGLLCILQASNVDGYQFSCLL